MRVGHLIAVALLLLSAPRSAVAEERIVEVFKSENCGCCGLWMDHLQRNGFTAVGRNKPLGELARIKKSAGLKPDLQSCHTGKIAGYVIEGHVPADDIRRLLADKPDAIGLAVPGMPIGSPGMEAGDKREPYQVLLVRKDGSTEVFAQY